MVFSGVGRAYQEIFAVAGTVRASEARWLGGGAFLGLGKAEVEWFEVFGGQMLR